jgi:hypothetical protein
MSSRFKSILAIWFALQITLPFTAPLQTCDLGDLLGHKHSTSEPDASTTPPLSESDDVNSLISPVESSALRASASIGVVPLIAMSAPLMGSFDLSPTPQVQQAVLRV